MHLLFVAATLPEAERLIQQFSFTKKENLYSVKVNNHLIELLLTGVGSINTVYQLQKYVANTNPNMVIQYGIAGIREHFTELGNCFFITEDCFADIGVFENNEYKNIFDMNFADANQAPFINGKLKFKPNAVLKLPTILAATSRTINLIESDASRLTILHKKYNTDAESMEGAAFHYVMLQTNIPFIQIRSASNTIGERNKLKWKMKLAIDHINELILEIIEENILKQPHA
jgi:futalosine hydrolase